MNQVRIGAHISQMLGPLYFLAATIHESQRSRNLQVASFSTLPLSHGSLSPSLFKWSLAYWHAIIFFISNLPTNFFLFLISPQLKNPTHIPWWLAGEGNVYHGNHGKENPDLLAYIAASLALLKSFSKHLQKAALGMNADKSRKICVLHIIVCACVCAPVCGEEFPKSIEPRTNCPCRN